MGLLVANLKTYNGLTVSNFYVNIVNYGVICNKLGSTYTLHYTVSMYSDANKSFGAFYTEPITQETDTVDNMFSQIYSYIISKYGLTNYENI